MEKNLKQLLYNTLQLKKHQFITIFNCNLLNAEIPKSNMQLPVFVVVFV